MRENFPHKQAGDHLSAGHINKLSAVARRMARAGVGNNIVARHGESSFSQSGQKPWKQITFIVTNTKINDDDTDDSGLYLGKTRWYDPTASVEEWKTDEDGTEWELDASDQDLTLAVGDKLTVWWNRQRGMYVPTGFTQSSAFIDLNGFTDESVEVLSSLYGGPTNEVRFGLIAQILDVERVINDRIITINAHRLVWEDATDEDITGSGFYTFEVGGLPDPDAPSLNLKVACQTDIVSTPIHIVIAGLRLEAKTSSRGFGGTTSSPFFGDKTYVRDWAYEIEESNGSENPLRFVINGNTIEVYVPPGEIWVIKAELMVTFSTGVSPDDSELSTTSQSSRSSASSSSSTSSQSSSSSISTSSISTSSTSISASSSSISTSSTSSSSTSSASSSSSSISSSNFIQHTRVVVDVCCEDDEVVVVYTDLLHDTSGHFLGTTGPDPPDVCGGGD